MKNPKIKVELFTIPQAACDSGKANWIQTGEMVKRQLVMRYGEVILFQHIEFMSEAWFLHTKANELLEQGNLSFPFVLVDNEVACADKKINISKVSNMIQQKLQQ